MRRMNRNIFSIALCTLLLTMCFPAGAQQPAKVPRIGFLGATDASRFSDRLDGFRKGLYDVGYSEGKNITIEYRWAKGTPSLLPALAAELVQLKVDVIVPAGGTQAILAAKNATKTIPIVFAGSNDPVSVGIVASFARPGGNITGLTLGGPELYGKRLEILKETIPTLSRVSILFDPTNASAELILNEIRTSARVLSLKIQPLEVRSGGDIDSALDAATKARADALIILEHPAIILHLKRIMNLAAQNRFPTMYADRERPEAGGFMSYGANISDLYRRAATYVGKILKGANPGDLPVEQPTKFELVINLKTAKAIGLPIPPTVLARADKVIK